MLDGMAKSLPVALQRLNEIPQQVLPGVPDAVLKRIQPDLLLFGRLARARPLNLDSLEHVNERQRCKVHVQHAGSRFL